MLPNRALFLGSGLAPGISRRGAESSDEGLKYGFQGTINAKTLRKNSLSRRGGYCVATGVIAFNWHHPCLNYIFSFCYVFIRWALNFTCPAYNYTEPILPTCETELSVGKSTSDCHGSCKTIRKHSLSFPV